jgi:hypothetical protein
MAGGRIINRDFIASGESREASMPAFRHLRAACRRAGGRAAFCRPSGAFDFELPAVAGLRDSLGGGVTPACPRAGGRKRGRQFQPLRAQRNPGTGESRRSVRYRPAVSASRIALLGRFLPLLAGASSDASALFPARRAHDA